MGTGKTNATTKTLVTVAFVLMVTVNALANTLPINDKTTGQVSESYRNLFAPAGLTFAIWGLIYVLLAVYTLYQLGVFRKKGDTFNEGMLQKVGFYFILSSIANAAWIFSWHYDLIVLSMLLMIIILVCLISISQTLNKERLTGRERFFIRLPFSVYFGWITVATIANATVLLVGLSWNGFGISDKVWTVLVLLVGMLIGTTTMLKNKDIAYGLVLVWAYVGILIKHVSQNGFAGNYPAVIATTIVCIAIYLGAILLIAKPWTRCPLWLARQKK
jgi:hypothetical protein